MKKSVNKFARRAKKRADKGWNGDNLKIGVMYGGEEFGNKPYGIDEIGEIVHFEER